MRVLIAEDERLSRHALQMALEEWGYDVVVTQNGSEAWHVLQQDGAPSLAILDWMMPEMSGVE
ncbi:MAG: response regulator, partial [Candidatus Tectomicrobia bacterium]|nr:response regulator [Candidatus Tectomicrobia bacterium]